MIVRAGQGASSWQLVLADLALILFLVTLATLAGQKSAAHQKAAPDIEIAASQALFRPTISGPTLAQWLAQRPEDPRATLTIIARHSGSDQQSVWRKAQDLATSARGHGFSVRVIIEQDTSSDIYASLAYDAETD